jgi:drug/metabolite transporter (DMT)-like permease
MSAFLFAASHITSKRGVQTTSVIAGVLLSLGTGAVVLLVAVLASGAALPSGEAMLVLGASGILAPALARGGAIAGIDRLGPTTAIPIQGSVYPLCAVAGALLFLGESVGPARALGVIAIVLGIWILSSGHMPVLSESPTRAAPAPARARRALQVALLLPVIAGLSKGMADIVRKEGLDLASSAVSSAFVAQVAALLAWTVVLVAPPVRRKVRFGRGSLWFCAGGVLASLAVLSQFHALDRGSVSVVSPIVAAQPVAVIVLSALFLKDLDPLTLRRTAGALVAVIGTILVSIS